MAGRAQTSAQRKAAERWAAFLNRKLALRGWRQADLIRAAGRRSDGKPVLSSSRVSQWTQGQEAAGPDYAVIVAAALEVPASEALSAITAIEPAGGGEAMPRPDGAPVDDEAFIAKLRSSSDPEMHKLADRFEEDLERIRRVNRIEFEELQRRRQAENGDATNVNTSVNKSA